MLIGALIGLAIALAITIVSSVQAMNERDRFNANPINQALGRKRVSGGTNPLAYVNMAFMASVGAIIGYFVQ